MFQSTHTITGYYCSNGKAGIMWTCFSLSVYAPPHEYSTSSLKLYERNITHYLDDFLSVFPPGTDTKSVSHDFDHVLKKFGLSKAVDKDAEGCVMVHLGFEFDSSNMRVRLPPNKRNRAVNAINLLLSSPPNPCGIASIHLRIPLALQSSCSIRLSFPS